MGVEGTENVGRKEKIWERMHRIVEKSIFSCSV